MMRLVPRKPQLNGTVTIAGAWKNEYGSRLTLSVEGSMIRGSYESTTGSSGRYLVVGRQGAAEPTAEIGQPVALAISWRSIAEGAPDVSWCWVSSLGGQLSIIGDEEVLILNHLLIAACALPGVCDQGIYVDKLTYRRVPGAVLKDGGERGHSNNVDNPLIGSWRARDGTELDLLLRPEAGYRVGFVSGTLSLGTRSLEVVGLADLGVDMDDARLQAVAMTAVDPARGAAVTLGGWVDRASGALAIQSLTNYATAPDSTYLQTAVRPLDFSRAERSEPQDAWFGPEGAG